MRIILLLIICLGSILSFCHQDILAQDYIKWNLPDGAKLRLGKGLVGRLTFSPDGAQLYTNSTSGIWKYDVNTGKEIGLIPENSYHIISINTSLDMFVGIENNETVCIYNFSTSKKVAKLEGNTDNLRNIVFSPDGSTLAGSIYDEIYLWDVSTGELKNTLSGHTHSIGSTNFSPDSKTLASGSWDETIRLWDVDNYTQIYKLTLPTNSVSNNGYGIGHVLFSPDGKTLATSSYNERKVRFWDVLTGDQKAVYKVDGLEDMDFSPDSKTLAIAHGSNRLQLLDVATGKISVEFTGHQAWIWSIKFNPDGNTIASGGMDELYLWDTATGAQKMIISGHTNWVDGITFSPDGSTIAAGSRYNIRLWNAITGQHKAILYENHTFSGNKSMAFSPDGNTLASEIGWSIRLWNVADRTHQAELKGYLGGSASGYGIVSLAYSPDGKYLASGSSDASIQVWYQGRTYKGQLLGHKAGIWSIDFSYDSRYLVSGSYDNTVKLWNIESGYNFSTLIGHTDAVKCVAFSPDGSLVASGSEDNTVIIWNVAEGAPMVTLVGHPSWLKSVSFSKDGKILASTSIGESVIRLWDVRTGTPIKTLSGHSYNINNVVFSPDGKTLASSSASGIIYLWHIPSDFKQPIEDVNRDGVVDIHDLIYVASKFGTTETENNADVNKDGVVDITDILLIAGAIVIENAVPSKYSQGVELLKESDIQQWLQYAQQLKTKTTFIKKGIMVLEQLLVKLKPLKTSLMANYPNPFNPETWIPYQLANPSNVLIRIYSANGQLVKTLVIGYRSTGIYSTRQKAAYWDGKNEFGEPVASGIYFYTLSAGAFIGTRRMVINK